VKVRVNGRERDVPEGTSLQDFVLGAGIRPEGTIAELNEKVIRRDAWKEVALCDGDRLELVSLVGGG
jgi:sulfur carrier protein